jgi:hypothetical protein
MPTIAARGMVASPHALASAAGAEALRAGGSAVDAAIARAAALGVIYPHMCGIGGDAFWLVYDAAARKVRYLDGGGRAARAATLERFSGQSEIPFRGIVPATLTTPGAVASFCAAHQRYGKLPLGRCLQDAIHYARDGYPVSERLARWTKETNAELAQDPGSAALFLRSPGKNPALARTLEAIAAQGRAGFYEGEVAAQLAGLGGIFTAADLAAQPAEWGEPIHGTYRGVTIYETPAPTQGFTVLEMLNLLEPLELHKRDFLGPDHVHLLVQAKQIAYNDRDRWLAGMLLQLDPHTLRLWLGRGERRFALVLFHFEPLAKHRKRNPAIFLHGMHRDRPILLELHSFGTAVVLGLVACFLGIQVLGAGVQRAESAGTAKLTPLIPVAGSGESEAEAAHDFVRLHVVTKEIARAKLRAIGALVASGLADAVHEFERLALARDQVVIAG